MVAFTFESLEEFLGLDEDVDSCEELDCESIRFKGGWFG